MSVSCPTAEIVGTRTAASARQTASVLKAARSSLPPPPRPTMHSSTSGIRFTSRSARTSAADGAVALHPRIHHEQPAAGPPAAHDRDDVVQRRSREAGDDGDGDRELGKRPLPRGVEEPVLLEQRPDPLELLLRGADAPRWE